MFPFTAALEAVLKAQKAEHERLKKADKIVPLVFHRHGKTIRDCHTAWNSACQAAGVPGLPAPRHATVGRAKPPSGMAFRGRRRWR